MKKNLSKLLLLISACLLILTACTTSPTDKDADNDGGGSGGLSSSSGGGGSSSSASAIDKDISSFSFHTPSVVGTISGTDITVNLPFSGDKTRLRALITLDDASCTVTVNSAVQDIISGTYNDYSSPVTFRVTATDATYQDYTVTVRYYLNAVTYSGTGVSGYVNGAAGSVQYSALTGIASDGNNLYVADGNNTIRKVVKNTGVTSTIAGVPGSTTNGNNAIGTNAAFRSLAAITIDPAYANLYVVCDNIGSSVVRKIALSGAFPVTTLATIASSVASGVTADSAGNVYVAAGNNGRIYKVTSAGAVTTLAGSSTGTMADGTGAAAVFQYPRGVVCDGNGNLYVSDYKLRKIVISTGVVTTVSSNNLSPSGSPYTIAYDYNMNRVFTFYKYGYNLRMCSLTTGQVVDVAGTGATGANNLTPGLGTDISFSQAEGICLDPLDNDIFIADYDNNVVRRVY